jgi:Ca2+-binding RTX toxin-like protein
MGETMNRPRATVVLALGLALLAALLADDAAGASAPSCAAGPERVGNTIHGTPCADVIHAPASVSAVYGGGGNDTIVPGPIAALTDCPEECRLGVGSQTFDGGPGNDTVFGERGNDTLNGGEGDDRLYGGIGDDTLRGGTGNDLLAAGHGADSLDGEAGDDHVRGDGTIDDIADSGGGFDTLSYSTGVTPGFGGSISTTGFPPAAEGRGVRLDLGATGLNGENGVAPFGGGADEVQTGAFEKVIGTPFSDYIVGSGAGETIYGGGGADVILGEGGNDHLFGGAEGDLLDGGAGTNTIDGGSGEDHCESPAGTSCEAVGEGVIRRDPAKIAAGVEAPQEAGLSQLYLTGSSTIDVVTATYAAGPPASVTFQLGASSAPFDASAAVTEGCAPPSAGSLVCGLSAPLDSIVLAGLNGEDDLTAVNFPSTTSVMVLGGEGGDHLTGGEQTEDVLVDGPGSGSDNLQSLGRDDALMHNGGTDSRLGGTGNDLFLSNSICDGDTLNGGEGRDNSSWTKLEEPVEASLTLGKAGRPGSGESPTCGGGETTDTLQQIEDLEGTGFGDFFYGNSEANQLLGWSGADSYFAQAGDDSILANAEDADSVIDCGEGNDSTFTDDTLDPAPVACESVNGVVSIYSLSVAREGEGTGTVTSTDAQIECGSACSASYEYGATVTLSAAPAAGSTFTGWSGGGCSGTGSCEVTITEATGVIATFSLEPEEEKKEEEQPPPPGPGPPATPPAMPPPVLDLTPPVTKLQRHPARTVRTRRLPLNVAFGFASEAGAHFRCKLDGGGFAACRSPRTYRVRGGRHVFRVFAIDANGNRDTSPVVFEFSVERDRGR